MLNVNFMALWSKLRGLCAGISWPLSLKSRILGIAKRCYQVFPNNLWIYCYAEAKNGHGVVLSVSL